MRNDFHDRLLDATEVAELLHVSICPACGSANVYVIYRGNRHGWLACDNCDIDWNPNE